MKKKILISVVSSVAIALFFAGQKQSSINVLVSDNVEALSDGDTDIFKVFGILTKHTLKEYPTSSTLPDSKGYDYASKSSSYVLHPGAANDPDARLCNQPELVNINSTRYGIYCYTITPYND